MEHRLTPLNKDHLKNVMLFISKLFNGVNVDHQNLQKLSLTVQALCHCQPFDSHLYFACYFKRSEKSVATPLIGLNAMLRTGSARNLYTKRPAEFTNPCPNRLLPWMATERRLKSADTLGIWI